MRYMETFFKGKSKSDQILEQITKKSCEISFVRKKQNLPGKGCEQHDLIITALHKELY